MNIYTKKSQWDKPTEPVYPTDTETPPPGAPPGYASGGYPSVSDTKTNPYDTDNRAGMGGSVSPNHLEEDAKLAAKLQAEEDARAQGTRGNAMNDYMNTSMPQQSSQQLPPREEKRGLFSKLLGKDKANHQSQYGQPQYGQPQYGQPAYGGPQPGYGGYPPQGYGGYPPQGYNAYPPQGYGGGYPPGNYAQAPPRKSGGGGLGMAGGAALGLGGGLIGGMLLEDAIQDHDQNEYQQGYGKRSIISIFGKFTNLSFQTQVKITTIMAEETMMMEAVIWVEVTFRQWE